MSILLTLCLIVCCCPLSFLFRTMKEPRQHFYCGPLELFINNSSSNYLAFLNYYRYGPAIIKIIKNIYDTIGNSESQKLPMQYYQVNNK